MEALFTDAKHSLRTFARSPGFTVAALAALALGIGANTAVFSILNAVLLKPLPYPEPDRIVIFKTSSPEGPWLSAASPVEFNVWRQQTDIFQAISAYRYGQVVMTGVDHSEQIHSAIVSADYFRLFGHTAARGRVFTADEDRPGAGDFVVLSDKFWRRSFGADPGMIGRTISLNGRPYLVIGIMAPGFETDPPASATFDTATLGDPIDVWMPFQIDPGSNDLNGYFNVAARLKPAASIQTATALMQLVTQEFRRKFPLVEGLPTGAVFTVEPMRDALERGQRSPLSILFGAVVFVLLVACANVANLLLARAEGRKREIAIRMAIGAGRGRIIRQLLTESVVLSLVGGALGVALGIVGIRALLAINTVNIPRIGAQGAAVTVDLRVLCFTVLVSLATGIVFGLIPALHISRADSTEALKDCGGRSGTGRRENKVRSLLVISEVTLALVLLVGTGLLIRSFVALRSINPGFEPRDVLTMQIPLTDQRFQKTARVAELVRDSIQRFNSLPGVTSAAFTCCLPLENRTAGDVIIAGRPVIGRSHGVVDVATISPHYFEVLKIPILRGRAFNEGDVSGTGSVVIISEAMARRYWPKHDDALSDPLNANLIFPDFPNQTWRVIGIVGDVHADGLDERSPAIVYFSVAQAPDDFTAYLVRSPLAWIVGSREQSHSLSAEIQNEFVKVGAGLPVPIVRSMEEVMSRSTGGRRFDMLLLTTFGGSALLLAAIGIYGFIAYSAQQRRQEIGIRLALGAQPTDVRNMVMLQGIRLALSGICIGITSAFPLSRIIAAFLFGVQVHDRIVFVAVPAFLSVVALAAVWLPALQASRISPIEALRHE